MNLDLKKIQLEESYFALAGVKGDFVELLEFKTHKRGTI